jgi:hypothetical protein
MYIYWTPPNQQGWLVFLPLSNRLKVSQDCHFDETFSNALCRPWIPFSDAFALRAIKSLPPKPTSVQEYTGDANTLPTPNNLPNHPKEGNGEPEHTQDSDETQFSGFQDLNLNFPEYQTQEGCKPS